MPPIDKEKFATAVGKLRSLKLQLDAGELTAPLEPSMQGSADVLLRFQPMFAPERLPQLTAEEFRDFLPLSANRHWSGLQRLGPKMTADMDALRHGLGVLLDESRPLDERYDYAIGHVKGLGRAVATAVLLIVYPDKYGVWNTTSEEALKRLDLWPAFDRGEREGKRYVAINDILLRLSAAVGVDLWTLDALWYYLLAGVSRAGDDSIPIVGPIVEPDEDAGGILPAASFGLERHLHEFMRDNWGNTELGKDWALFSEPGNETAGYEYPCSVGRIDLLAKHKSDPKWLVIELKRSQTGDQTVGQVLRYMGWVQENLAAPGEEVCGMIVAQSTDDALRYAVRAASSVELRHYEVKFTLHKAPAPAISRQKKA